MCLAKSGKSSLWQYKDGYHIDVYSMFQIESGGLMNLGVDFVRSFMGNSDQFTPRTIKSIKSHMEALGANVELVTAYPDELAIALKEEGKH